MTNAPTPPSKRLVRRAVFLAHLWLGLIVGLYFVVVGATGSILVFQDEIDGRRMPEIGLVAPPRPGAVPLSLSSVLAHTRSDFPGASGRGIFSLTLPDHAGGAYRVYLRTEKGAIPDVATIDPYTGGVIRRQAYGGWPRRLHIFLLLGLPGEIANGYGALAATVLLLTGLWLWWPATARQIRARLTVKRGGGVKRVTHDIHNVFGIYAFPLLLVLALTGAALVFAQPYQDQVYRLTRTPPDPKPPMVAAPAGAARLSLDDLTLIAAGVAPRGEPYSVSYPRGRGQAFTCFKRSGSLGMLTFVRVFIDPYTGRLLRVEDDRSSPLGAKVVRITGALHYGQWGGLPVKAVYACAGLVPLVLYVTGILMYLRKRGRDRSLRPAFRSALAALYRKDPPAREGALLGKLIAAMLSRPRRVERTPP